MAARTDIGKGKGANRRKSALSATCDVEFKTRHPVDIAQIDLTENTAIAIESLIEGLDEPQATLAAHAAAAAFTEESDILAWSCGLLMQSPASRHMLVTVAAAGWAVALEDLGNNGFCLNLAERTLCVDHQGLTPRAISNSPYFRNAILIAMIRGLRDIGHETALAGFETAYNPEAILTLERLRAADGDTMALQVAWELRGEGYSDAWRHLIGSDTGDMAMVFARVLERDPSAIFTGAALAHAFRQWFADEARVDACDHETLENMDHMLEAAADRNPFGARRLTAETVESLSALQDGSRYLRGHGAEMVSSPLYAGLSDPINQTHLLHLMYDLEVYMVANVPFRDRDLARKFFPDAALRTYTI